jgi:hypothetical protein
LDFIKFKNLHSSGNTLKKRKTNLHTRRKYFQNIKYLYPEHMKSSFSKLQNEKSKDPIKETMQKTQTNYKRSNEAVLARKGLPYWEML